MKIRKKNDAIRITFSDFSKPNTVHYVSILPTSCWRATFNGWGKSVESAIVELGGKNFKITLEEIP